MKFFTVDKVEDMGEPEVYCAKNYQSLVLHLDAELNSDKDQSVFDVEEVYKISEVEVWEVQPDKTAKKWKLPK